MKWFEETRATVLDLSSSLFVPLGLFAKLLHSLEHVHKFSSECLGPLARGKDRGTEHVRESRPLSLLL